MTHYTKRARPVKPRGKQIRNLTTFWAGGVEMEQTKPRGPQPESLIHPEIAAWRNGVPGLVLERNKRRLATPPGMSEPIMLGWLCDDSPDWIGYLPVTITQSMVGKSLAVFVGIEVKRRKGGALSDGQVAFLDALRDAGGIAGHARSAIDANSLVDRWRDGH